MRLTLACATTVVLSITVAAQQPALTPRVLETELATKPQGAAAEALATRIRTAFGGQDGLTRGAARADELMVAASRSH